MEQIKQKYSINGFNLRLEMHRELAIGHQLALYSLHKGGGTFGYELQHLRRRKEGSEMMGKPLSYLWRHPSNEDFGRYGWHIVDKTRAIDRFNAFVLPDKEYAQ